MMNYRLVAAGAIAACFIAGTSGAIATAGTDGPSAKPTSSATSTDKPTAQPDISTELTAAAHVLGVTTEQLSDALNAAKRASVTASKPVSKNRVEPDVDAAAASLARSLHVSQKAAKRVFTQLLSTPTVEQGPPQVPDARVVASLASFLDITNTQAQHVWDALSASNHGMDPSSHEFADLANSLGLTAGQLQERLRAFKMSFANGADSSTKAKTKDS
jgi:hypothetical protein